MTHYFSDNNDLISNRKEHKFSFYGNDFIFITDTGVFSKSGIDEGTIILLDAIMQENITGDVMDLGCGYGVISIILKRLLNNINMTAIDINGRAIELTQLNAEKNQVDITSFVNDGFTDINDHYDVIISNPPIRTGKKVIYKLFDEAYEHLNESGT